ncbi:MAG: hypothetical protein LUJ25_02035, partial [Firmicutes bacterium]|nr:hypothetical protein [Bacillota bacterium]
MEEKDIKSTDTEISEAEANEAVVTDVTADLPETSESPLKSLSENILAAVEREAEGVSVLYEKIAVEENMSKDEREAFSREIEVRTKSLEAASVNFLKASSETAKMSDELATRQKDVSSSEKKRTIIAPAPANSVIDAAEKNVKSFAQGINFYKLALICII